MEFYFVYALRSLKKEFIYIGYTDNLQRRLNEHNNGFVQSTKAYAPLKIAAYVAVATEEKAREEVFQNGIRKSNSQKTNLD